MKTLFKLPKKVDASTLLGADYFCLLEAAENDDNGNQSGKCGMISFGELITFEANNFVGYAFRTSTNFKGFKRLHISGQIYPYQASGRWCGNMIWNAYQIDAVSATEIINRLFASGKWLATGGDSELLEHLENGGLLTGDFIRMHREWEEQK